MSEEKTVIVCVRTKDAEDHISNATITNCSECDEPVWLSPASQEIVVDHNGVIICTQCIKFDKDAKLMELTEGQIQELKQHFKDENTTDRLRKGTRGRE